MIELAGCCDQGEGRGRQFIGVSLGSSQLSDLPSERADVVNLDNCRAFLCRRQSGSAAPRTSGVDGPPPLLRPEGAFAIVLSPFGCKLGRLVPGPPDRSYTLNIKIEHKSVVV